MVKNNYHEVGIINFKYYNIYLLKNNNYTYILKKLLKKKPVSDFWMYLVWVFIHCKHFFF